MSTSPLGEERQLAGVIAAALRLAGAAMSTTPDGVHEAELPTSARIHFGNRPTLRYALDRAVRQFHADVELVTPGSALLTQAIQFIRERTSVIYRAASDSSTAPNLDTALRPLVVADLPIRVLQVDPLRPDFVARAQVLVTLLSDDRRSFLHEVTIPLEIPAQRRARALELQRATVVVPRQAHWPLPASLRDIVTTVLDAADAEVKPKIHEREAEIEAMLQDASRRLSRPALDALRRDLALRVELDVAILELAVLERVQYRAAVTEPRGTRELTFTIEVYADEELSALCPVCRGESKHLDLCLSPDMHLVCPVCGIRCTQCGARRCRQHPLSPCSDPACHGSFCEACSSSCGQCGSGTCAQHRADCVGCGETACTTCLAECAFEPGLPMHSDHVQRCRDCGRLACPGHGGLCGLEAPGALRLCADDLKVCETGGHGIAVCASHRVTCAGCGKTSCHQHAGSCAESTCNDAFCDACSQRCGQCGKRACHQHRADCAMGCGRTACTTCQAECALEPGQRMHSGHLKSCRECGRHACPRHTGECGDEAPGTAVVCIDDLRACTVGDHGLAVCVTHSVECAHCGRSACKQHANPCACCGRPGCTDDAGPCTVGREWVLTIHSRRCSKCDEPACVTHSVQCGRCHKVFCNRHATVCVAGAEPLCLDDALRCSQHDGATCVEHSVACSVGATAHVVCDRDACRSHCAEDSRPVCLGHVLACDGGGEPLCPEHGERCKTGGERLCPAHQEVCPVDGLVHCSVHAASCCICGRSTCLTCTTTSLGAGVAACDACLIAATDGSPEELARRPMMDRMLVRNPPVVRSGGTVTLISISRLRSEVQSFDAGGRVISRQRLDSGVARAYLDARKARLASEPPSVA